MKEIVISTKALNFISISLSIMPPTLFRLHREPAPSAVLPRRRGGETGSDGRVPHCRLAASRPAGGRPLSGSRRAGH
jgi:hypothetical protein